MDSPASEHANGVDGSVRGGSPDRFGYEWAEYDEVKPEYEELFQRWLPFFDKGSWQGKTFLDVGCGMGRNSFWPMTYGAAACTAIDLDDRSLASARRNLARFPTAEVQKLSAYDIDYRDHFDIVFSIGVIHHLEWPARALERLVAATKPGGTVAIWVYGRENNGWFLWVLDPLRKHVFSRFPLSLLHVLSNVPTALLWLALRLGLYRVAYFRLMREKSYRTLRLAVFDQLLPRIANYWRRDEVEQLMKDQGLSNVELCWVNEVSWAARGIRPSAEASAGAS